MTYGNAIAPLRRDDRFDSAAGARRATPLATFRALAGPGRE